jgi:curved DNA-binding protein CbpA
MAANKDYYAILGVARTASPTQVRERFRELARTRHPDRFQGAEKTAAELEFQAITEAFNVLSNSDRRRQYDASLVRPERSQPSDQGQVAKVFLQRGIKAYRDGNYLEAAESFDRATKSDAGNAQAWHHLALACSHQRRWLNRAAEAIVKACQLAPMNPAYMKLAGRIHADLGMTAEAEQYYNRALDWGGDDPAVREALEDLKKVAKRGRSGLFGKSEG